MDQRVGQPFFFVLPALAVGGAITLDWLWERWPAGRILAVATYLFLAATSLQTWLYRLATVRQDWSTADPRIVGEKVAPLLAGLWRLISPGSS